MGSGAAFQHGNGPLRHRPQRQLRIPLLSDRQIISLYAHDTATGETRGRNGSSGNDKGGGSPEKPDPSHTKVGKIDLPSSVSGKDFMNKLNQTAESGAYVPGCNDCHTSISNAANSVGGKFTPNQSYQGRVSSPPSPPPSILGGTPSNRRR